MSAELHHTDHMPGVSRRTLRFRRAVSALCVSGMVVQMGCYTSVPVQTAAGTPMNGIFTVTVNDRGRLLVGEKLGSLLDRVDGRVSGSDDRAVQVTVNTAYDVRGGAVNWGGEPVSIPREGIASITQRRVEKGSTILVLGGIAAVLVGIFAGLHHTSSSSGQDDPGGPPSGGPINRIPLHH